MAVIDPVPYLNPDPNATPSAADLEIQRRYEERKRSYTLWCTAILSLAKAPAEAKRQALRRAEARWRANPAREANAATLRQAMAEGKIGPDEARALGGFDGIVEAMCRPLQMAVCSECSRRAEVAEHAGDLARVTPVEMLPDLQRRTLAQLADGGPHAIPCRMVQGAVVSGLGTVLRRPRESRSILVFGPDPFDISHTLIDAAFTSEALAQVEDIYAALDVPIG